MICPKCNETDHERGAKFCHVCGAMLQTNNKAYKGTRVITQKCPTCGASQPAGARFCNNCGACFNGKSGAVKENSLLYCEEGTVYFATLNEAREKEEAERIAAEKKAEREAAEEDAAYKRCTSIEGCDAYLNAYPRGRYVKQVQAKKAEQEEQSKPKDVSGTANGHDYVDLGLPSGTLWATCNIGANKPEDYGDYFAWGEIKPKTIYDWDTYKYGKVQKRLLLFRIGVLLTKYCNKSEDGYEGFTDRLTVLQFADDPAVTNWGNGWYMPSKKQWEELKENTKNNWTTRNGVNGWLFTANNGNSLFLPAAGFRGYKSFNEGTDGSYLSSSLYEGDPSYSWGLGFRSCHYGMFQCIRDCGCSVRPVRY